MFPWQANNVTRKVPATPNDVDSNFLSYPATSFLFQLCWKCNDYLPQISSKSIHLKRKKYRRHRTEAGIDKAGDSRGLLLHSPSHSRLQKTEYRVKWWINGVSHWFTGHFLLSEHTWSHICSTYPSLLFDYHYFLYTALEATCATHASLNLSLLHYITNHGCQQWYQLTAHTQLPIGD